MANRPLKDDPDQHLLDFIPERFDADGDSRQAKRGAQGRLVLSIALSLAAVVATVVTIWYIFANQPAGSGNGGVPLVTAEQGPVKTKPVEPGGMEVPNQDKLVYERLGSDMPAQPERLLPPPEEPKTPPAAAAPSMSLAAPKPRMEVLDPVEAPPAAAAAAPPKPTAAEPPVEVAAEPVPPSPETPSLAASSVATAPPAPPPPVPAADEKPEAPAPAPAVKSAPAPAAAAPAAIVAPTLKKGAWLIQIAAMRDSEAAQKEWSRVQGANRDLMGALTPDIVRADLGARGIFWRVRGGPLDEMGARRLCEELGKRKIGCMVVRK